MINNIQALRAFAAINVVFFHIILTSAANGQSTDILGILEDWGANGVDIFFVISGFVMLHTQMQRKKSAKDFLVSRFLRIVPIYWLMTTFMVVLYAVLPSIFRQTQLTANWTASSYLFTSQYFFDEYPVVFVGWTLEWEMLFYLIFALALLLNSWKLMIFSVGTALLAIAVFSGQYIVLEFFLGMVVAYLFNSRQIARKTGLLVFLAGSFLLALSISPDLSHYEIDRALLWGIPSFLMVMGALYAPQLRSPLLSYLGDASYSIYLVQILTIPAFYRFSSKLVSSANGDLLSIICLVVSVIAGCLMYRLIEKPTTIFLKQRIGITRRL